MTRRASGSAPERPLACSALPAQVGPVLVEFSSQGGSEYEESDEVGERHGENHGVGEIEDRRQARRAAHDAEEAIEGVERDAHRTARAEEIDAPGQSVVGPGNHCGVGK